ncbi:hypothetical protein HGRIS_001040 [Hohenbuehelia grisea]|uniref:Uncharacterized protein n=1 Tax=Hohenbuehelia grisea TaxID=104357 RepID=A0ABR3JNB4_9AGAR
MCSTCPFFVFPSILPDSDAPHRPYSSHLPPFLLFASAQNGDLCSLGSNLEPSERYGREHDSFKRRNLRDAEPAGSRTYGSLNTRAVASNVVQRCRMMSVYVYVRSRPPLDAHLGGEDFEINFASTMSSRSSSVTTTKDSEIRCEFQLCTDNIA